MAELSASQLWEALKSLGLNLPDNCIRAKIIMDGPGEAPIIECEVIATMTPDENGGLPMATKRYKLVEAD